MCTLNWTPTNFLRGEYVVRQSGPLAVSMWRGNKVTIMSTNVQPGEEVVIHRKQRDGTTLAVPASASVQSYNKWMGGVDQGDQLRKYYQLRLKSKKFYKYIFWFLIDVCIINTYRLHTQHSNSPCNNLKTFRLELAKALIGSYNSRKRPVPRREHHISPLPPPPSSLKHFPIKCKTSSQKGLSRCWYCSHVRKPPVRKETTWYCCECDLHLCHTGVPATDCFLQHHRAM